MIKIAVGIGENKNIIKAVDIFKNKKNIEIKLIKNDNDLVKSIKNTDIDCTVRGSLPASGVIKELKKEYRTISRATYIKGEYEFLLTPVGIDEGKTIEEKLEIAKNCCNFLEKLSKTPKIGVLSNGRKGDYKRSKKISTSIDESEKLVRLIKENLNAEVINHYILIEKAIKDNCNIIIAPDGIIGNIIFRTLVLLNSWPSYGAITFGVNSIYIDTSRDQSTEGYLRSLNLAYELANL